MPENNSQPERVSTLAQFWSSVNYPLNTEDPLTHQQDEHDRLSDYSITRTKKGPAIGAKPKSKPKRRKK